jgi:hypothetical protein
MSHGLAAHNSKWRAAAAAAMIVMLGMKQATGRMQLPAQQYQRHVHHVNDQQQPHACFCSLLAQQTVCVCCLAPCRNNGCAGDLEQIHNSIHGTVGGLTGEMG